MALLNQITRHRQSRRPTAHNGHFLSCGLYMRDDMRAHALLVVGDEALQISDTQRLYLLREKALPFALIFLRADASSDRGEHVGFADLRRGAKEVADHDSLDKLFHVDAYGTIVGTGRFGAFQAAQR